MFALRYTRLVALGILMVAGCGNTGSGTDAGNCAANPPGCICRTDGNCGGANPRCNNSDGQCVPCLPTNDNCAQGQHCVNDSGTFKCVATTVCISAVDCPRKTPNATPACCNGTCVDNTLSDAANCGGCDLKCPSFMNAEPACIGGACAIAKCNTGFDNCDGNLANGCETNTAADVRHCGNCATVCTTGGNATPQCMAGKCMAGCVAGFQDCDGSLNNGCEVSTDTDARNCGACGKACGALQNAATVVCKAGACTAGSCAGWYGDCDNNPANGCESDTQGEAANCGGCGKPCAAVANGTPGCANGACTVNKCNAGYGNCDNDAKNGCEVKTSSDALNCGACGISCGGANSQQSCSNGSCVVAACNQGFADCDMKAANGCEVNVLSDVGNCNGCGMACPVPSNTIAICRLGVCAVGACKPGFADCNKDPADGCEVDVTTTSDCGGCGVMCAVPANAIAACRNGVCGIGMCNMGFADCDQNIGNGCEVNVQSNNNNCGICGLVCVPPMGGNIGNQCTAGKCVVGGCIQGYADCDMNKVDCEIDVRSDAKNCGQCGVVCPMNTPYCISGVCGVSNHGTKQLAFDFTGGSGGCGDFSIWVTQNLGLMSYTDCETQANIYGAEYVGSPNLYNYAAPYMNNTRWAGEYNATTGFVAGSNWGWSVLSSYPKVTNNVAYCVLGYAGGNTHGNVQFNKTAVSQNGKVYKFEDYGIIPENTCHNNARLAGARTLNPWMFAGQPGITLGQAHMIENHSCHGSIEYANGLGQYFADGNSNHNYRCLVGYTDN